jgi:hypothetical protein
MQVGKLVALGADKLRTLAAPHQALTVKVVQAIVLVVMVPALTAGKRVLVGLVE